MSQSHSRDNTVFLRFLAIVLVINSHMDSLYPMPIFATGGAMGNSLFFMLSAYGLLLSESYLPQTFTGYYSKRILRIYPVVWLSIVFLILPLAGFYYLSSSENAYQAMVWGYGLNNPLSLISMIFYPPFWFLQALMFFYILGFFFIKNYTIKKIVKAYIFLGFVYIIAYMQFQDYSALVIEQTMAFKLIFYAMVFLFGIYLASYDQKIVYSGVRDFVLLFFIIALIYAHKFLWYKGILTEWQFVQQLLIFPMLFYFMKVSRSQFVLNGIMQQKYIAPIISVIATMTLELYIVHGLIRPLFVQHVPDFPENVILYLFFVFLLSYILYRVNEFFIERLKKGIT